MRILATNPDAMGDLILRQPLYAALAEAGHHLTLVVHARHEALARQVAPGADVVTFAENPYRARFEAWSTRLDALAVRVREVRPDVLVVPAHQWTAVDARVARACGAGRRVRLSGRSFAEAMGYPAIPLDGFEVVEVGEHTAETAKHAALAHHLLGDGVVLGEPRIAADEASVEAGGEALARSGIEGEAFWIACVGETEATRVRNWKAERWAGVLRAWTEEWPTRFLLVGTEEERGSLEAIASGCGACVWAGGVPDDALRTLIGLCSLARGYVGRDTGPMHLAAAMGKPVLAVFGGGTFPRFLPRANPSVSITVGVPCAGCGWHCHLSEAVCIGEVPEEAVRRAGDRLARGEVAGREVEVLPAGEAILTRIGVESAEVVRTLRREATISQRRAIERGRGAEASERETSRVGDPVEAARREADEQRELAGEHARARMLLVERVEELAMLLARTRAGQVGDAAGHGEVAAGTPQGERVAELEARLRDAEARLRQLAVSRWRRLGLRLGVVRTHPWERAGDTREE